MQNKIYWIKRGLQWLIWTLKSERQQLEIELTLDALQFISPRVYRSPTVLAYTRCRLEKLRDIEFSGYTPGLSDEGRALTEQALSALIDERIYTTSFPMATLHGCAASKTNMTSSPGRASCATMAEMGALVKDLRDLEGKEGGDIIQACLEWPQLRLDSGIELLTDTWHQRFYWCNEGGSHHMAVLCYELVRQGKEWCPDVKIRNYTLKLNALNLLKNSISIYVVMHKPNGYDLDHVFKPLKYRQNDAQRRDRLGVTFVDLVGDESYLGGYGLVVVDHSKLYAPIALARLDEAVFNGYAQPLRSFLYCLIDNAETLEESSCRNGASNVIQG